MMKQMYWSGVAIASAISLVAMPAQAQTVTVNTIDGTLFETTELASFASDGVDLLGINVTAGFLDGTFETLNFADIPGGGGVSGNGWALSFTGGTTFLDEWNLTIDAGTSLTGFSISGAPGDTVFDILDSGTGTPGSALGAEFSLSSISDSSIDLDVTYSNLVALTGQAPVGDLFESVSVQFSSALGGIDGGFLDFIADTDNSATAGDVAAVPEPFTVVGAGLALGLGGILRRKYAR